MPAAPEFAPTSPNTDSTVPVTPEVTPETPITTPEAAPSTSRIVPMSYSFPTNLPAGSVEIVVRDDDGERVILPATDSAQLAGNLAQRSDVSVRGNYSFTVRVNGQDYATFGP